MTAIIDDENSSKSVRSHFIHSISFAQQVKDKLGVIDGQMSFNRFFQAVPAFVDLVDEIEVGISRGRLKTLKKLNDAALKRLRTIWYGNVYLIVVRDKYHREQVIRHDIAYDKNILVAENEELRELPSLRNINPTDFIRSEEPMIGIRQTMNIPDAWENADWQQIVLAAKYFYNYSERRKPQFQKEEDVIYSKGLTLDLIRPVFFFCIDFLHFFFRKQMVILIHDIDEMLLDDQNNSGFNNENLSPKLEFVNQVE